MTNLDPRQALTPDQLAIVEAGAAALREDRMRTIKHWLAAGAAWKTLHDGARQFVGKTNEGRDALNYGAKQFRRNNSLAVLIGWRAPVYAPFSGYNDLCDDVCSRLEQLWPELANIDRRTRSAACWLFENQHDVLRWLNSALVSQWERNPLTHPMTIRERWERAHSPSPEEHQCIEEEQRRVSMILASRNKLLY
jgi:hypothetical protein